jgi:hypothetical protein
MKSAIDLVAFAHGDRYAGTLALMQAALRALDSDGHLLAAAYVDFAINAFAIAEMETASERLDGIVIHQ